MRPRNDLTVEPHHYYPDMTYGMGDCAICGQVASSLIHNVEGETPASFAKVVRLQQDLRAARYALTQIAGRPRDTKTDKVNIARDVLERLDRD